MATELEQKARELLAAELERDGYSVTLYAVRNGWKLPGLPDCALRAIAAALQQAQQPGQSFNEWFAEFDKQNHYPELLAREAWNAALRSQQPGAQAVGYVSPHVVEHLRAGGFSATTITPHRAMKDDVAIYTAPPPLPEGVSEEDVEAEAISLWHRFAPDDRIEWDEEPHKAEYRDAARSILESYRARLAARGEKGVQGG